VIFVETIVFTRLVTSLLDDTEYAGLQQQLADQPDAGQLIQGGSGVRKIRWAARGSGKSRGVRIIYFWRSAEGQIFLLYLLEKSAQSDLSRSQLAHFAEIARGLK
jgi:hypothetical protein